MAIGEPLPSRYRTLLRTSRLILSSITLTSPLSIRTPRLTIREGTDTTRRAEVLNRQQRVLRLEHKVSLPPRTSRRRLLNLLSKASLPQGTSTILTLLLVSIKESSVRQPLVPFLSLRTSTGRSGACRFESNRLKIPTGRLLITLRERLNEVSNLQGTLSLRNSLIPPTPSAPRCKANRPPRP